MIEPKKLTSLLLKTAHYLGRINRVGVAEYSIKIPLEEKLQPLLYEIRLANPKLIGDPNSDANGPNPYSREVAIYFDNLLESTAAEIDRIDPNWITMHVDGKQLLVDEEIEKAAVELAKKIIDNRAELPEYFKLEEQ